MRRKDREVTEFSEIGRILDLCKTCHVAMQDAGELYLVPLSYGYELKEGLLTLYFHSAKEGRKLDIFRENPNVCFEMCCEGGLVYTKTPCNAGYDYSSLIGYGRVEFIEETEQKCKALSVMFAHQAGERVTFTEKQAETVCVYKIVSTRFSAKRKRSTTCG